MVLKTLVPFYFRMEELKLQQIKTEMTTSGSQFPSALLITVLICM